MSDTPDKCPKRQKEISEILQAVLDRDPRFTYGGKYIRWGMVEQELNTVVRNQSAALKESLEATQFTEKMLALSYEGLKAERDYVRPEVRAFAKRMERKLRQNEHKGGWKTCGVEWLLDKLIEETQELERAFCYMATEPERTVSEAVDVANFAMMIADLCLSLTEPEESE